MENYEVKYKAIFGYLEYLTSRTHSNYYLASNFTQRTRWAINKQAKKFPVSEIEEEKKLNARKPAHLSFVDTSFLFTLYKNIFINNAQKQISFAS